ncbi:MAG: Asp-tRNA(Asn)/Glu-tRNA(Gln) amidotransferase subunit GatB [Patescibacteria group bacterium]
MDNQQSTTNKSWETVIGVEIHIETNTKTKMFCGCSADYFGAKPNTHTCPVCLGLPGALPFINQEAIEKCIKIGLALGCSISEHSLFERKNYFYPDLPKGYQISQYRWPLCTNGTIEIDGEYGKKTIRINRAHQEEDTGKLTHIGSETFIDFNRSGLPLVEVVTEADFRNSEEVRDYAKKLQQIIKSIGVSEANMEKGDMRLEANVSVRPQGQEDLAPYRVELKNINSFKFIGDAIDYEVERQIKLLEKGEKITQHTRGYNERKKETFLQREKEEANDYRYFPEPDLPPLSVAKEEVEKIRAGLAELPGKKIANLEKIGVSEKVAVIITASDQKFDIFQEAITKIDSAEIAPLATFFVNQGSKSQSAEELLELFKSVTQQKSTQIQDEGELTKIAKEVIGENEKVIADYKSGKLNAVQILIGQLMKKTQGKADPIKAKNILVKLLS